MKHLSVLMTTEGTYPYASGGVSTWCDALLRNTPDVRYVLLPLMMNPHIEAKFDLPSNVHKVLQVPMWGIEEPAEFMRTIPFAGLVERKRKTSAAVIEDQFVPLFRRLLECINVPDNPGAFGQVLLEMEDYFRRYDYNLSMKSRPVWDVFRSTMEEHSRRMLDQRQVPGPAQQAPSLFDLTESLRWLFRLLIILNAQVPRTSVTHSTAAAFCGIPAITSRLRHGTPMVLTEHGVYLREQNLFFSRFRRLFFCKQFLLNLITIVSRANYFFADVIAPVCQYNTRWELAHGTPAEKIRVIYNGIDTDQFEPRPRMDGPLHVVATARIDPLKDIETLLRVAAQVRTTHPAVRFTIYGAVDDRKYYEKCLSLRAELDLDQVVTMGASTEHVVAAYAGSDVVILTSVSEAFPYSVIEAMACERPVVATDVGGVREALQGCGALVKPRDETAFASQLRLLLDDPELRREVGRRSRQRVLERFRLDQVVNNYLALYEELGRDTPE